MESSRETKAAQRHNLPNLLTPFIGREREIGEIVSRFGTARLLTLVGAGGVGKTRLALRIGAEVVSRYPAGVWLVELAPLIEPLTIPRAIASVLGVQEVPSQGLTDTLAHALQSWPGLLILDNCEHLIAGASAIVARLLRACPDLTILATSREALGVGGEVIRRVPSLSVPDAALFAKLGADAVATLEEHDATRLFVDRAQASIDSFAVSEQNAPWIAQICRRLDGIPLAVELAAARARVLTPQQIAARLDDRLHPLADTSRTALSRHRTLRAAIDWSYDLLTEPEQITLRRFAVFAGGCTLEAAEAICAGDVTDGLPDLVTRLADKSLVTVDLSEAEARYRLLETIRAYALERLEASGEAETVRHRHSQYFLDLAERAEPELRGATQNTWLNHLEAEHGNLRAALQWIVQEDDAEMGLRLGGALSRFWDVRGHHSEARARLTAVLSLAGTRAHPVSRARALSELGFLAIDQGDYAEARTLLEESLAVTRALGDKHSVARSLAGLAWIATDECDYATARALHEESLAIGRELGDRRGIALALFGLGHIAKLHGDHTAARAYHEESLKVMRELGDGRNVARSLASLGWVWIEERDYAGARRLLTESLLIAHELGDLRVVIDGLRKSAFLALAVGRMDCAARLQGAAETLRASIGVPMSPSERTGDAGDAAAARAALGEVAFTTAWAEGQAMSTEQAVAYALEQEDGGAAGSSQTIEQSVARPPGSPLTLREAEVAQLVAGGLTNRQIAAELVISERTASSHLYRILGKLGFTARAQVAAWAVARGLATAPAADEAQPRPRGQLLGATD